MPYIYKVTNNINGKVYVGKTLHPVEKRWKEHCQDYKKERYKKRPLYRAMQKYGETNFSIEQLEECSADTLNDREVYWIEKLGSFKYGYNLFAFIEIKIFKRSVHAIFTTRYKT